MRVYICMYYIYIYMYMIPVPVPYSSPTPAPNGIPSHPGSKNGDSQRFRAARGGKQLTADIVAMLLPATSTKVQVERLSKEFCHLVSRSAG